MKIRAYALQGFCLLVGMTILAGCSQEDATDAQLSESESAVLAEKYDVLKVLSDFDRTDVAISAENAQFDVVPSGDGNALKIDFSNTARYSGVHLDFPEAQDWTVYDEYHMALDVENIADESIQLFLSISSGDSELHRHVVVAKGEKTTLFAPLDGLFWNIGSGFRENPKPWNTDESMFILIYGNYFMPNDSVTRVSLNTRTNMANTSLLVDNIRLRKNPDYDETFLHDFVDEFGQNANVDFPTKMNSLEEFHEVAAKELAELEKSSALPDRSRFGGWKDGPQLEATGFFRTAKVEGKWWMVDPEGYLFFSHGLANVRLANLFTTTGMDFKDDSIRFRDS